MRCDEYPSEFLRRAYGVLFGVAVAVGIACIGAHVARGPLQDSIRICPYGTDVEGRQRVLIVTGYGDDARAKAFLRKTDGQYAEVGASEQFEELFDRLGAEHGSDLERCVQGN